MIPWKPSDMAEMTPRNLLDAYEWAKHQHGEGE